MTFHGPITVNGQELSRVTLYDIGTKIHSEGSTPILINSEMNLSNENFLAYLNAGKVSITAREFLDQLKGDRVKELVQATKDIALIGPNRKVKQVNQVRELISSDLGDKLKNGGFSTLQSLRYGNDLGQDVSFEPSTNLKGVSEERATRRNRGVGL